jgi:hypothetical protein
VTRPGCPQDGPHSVHTARAACAWRSLRRGPFAAAFPPWRPLAAVGRPADRDFPQPKSPERDALSKPRLFHDGRPGEGQPGDDNLPLRDGGLSLTCTGIAFTVNRLTSVAPAAAPPVTGCAAHGGDCPQSLTDQKCTWSSSEQAYVPAEQPSAGEGPWLPAADAHPGWPGRPRRTPSQGPRAAERLTSPVAGQAALADELAAWAAQEVSCCRSSRG